MDMLVVGSPMNISYAADVITLAMGANGGAGGANSVAGTWTGRKNFKVDLSTQK